MGGRGVEERGKTGELVIASDVCQKCKFVPRLLPRIVAYSFFDMTTSSYVMLYH